MDSTIPKIEDEAWRGRARLGHEERDCAVMMIGEKPHALAWYGGDDGTGSWHVIALVRDALAVFAAWAISLRADVERLQHERDEARSDTATLSSALQRISKLREADRHPRGSFAEQERNEAVARERERCARVVEQLTRGRDAAVEAERKACVEAVRSLAMDDREDLGDDWDGGWEAALEESAAKILARGGASEADARRPAGSPICGRTPGGAWICALPPRHEGECARPMSAPVLAHTPAALRLWARKPEHVAVADDICGAVKALLAQEKRERDEAVAKEREACARIADRMREGGNPGGAADAIRSGEVSRG